MATATLDRELSVAEKVARCCEPTRLYCVSRAIPNADGFCMRLYGVGMTAINGESHPLVGLTHLLGVEERRELGIDEMIDGHVFIARGNRRYVSAQAVAVAIWRKLRPDVEKYPTVHHL